MAVLGHILKSFLFKLVVLVLTTKCLHVPLKKVVTDSILSESNHDRLLDDQGVRTQLKNYRDVQYFGTLGFGDPGASSSDILWMTLIFDTGSDYLWVPGPECTTCGTGKILDPAKFSTYSELGYTTTLKYGKGEVTGRLSQLTLYLTEESSIPNEQFVLVTSGKEVENQASDGLLGLGRARENPLIDTPSPEDEVNFLSSLHDAKVIEKPVFTLSLSHSLSDNEESWITFGVVDTTNTIEEYEWSPLEGFPYSFWYVVNSTIQFGDTIIETLPVALDTGTSLLLLPKEYVDKVYAKLPSRACDRATGACTCDVDDFPDVEITIGSRVYLLKPDDYVLYLPSANVCLLGINEMPSSKIPMGILGDVFLRGVNIAIDLENNQVAIARNTNKAPKIEPRLDYLKIALITLLVLLGIYCFYSAYRQYRIFKLRRAGKSLEGYAERLRDDSEPNPPEIESNTNKESSNDAKVAK